MNNRSNDTNYYAILRVSPDVTEDAIRQSYRRLAREFHPDVAGEAGAETMKLINAAYRVLSDPERRREYDLKHGIVHKAFGAEIRSSAAAPQRARNTTPQPTPFSQPRPSSTQPPPLTRSDGPMRLFRQLGSFESAIESMAFAQGDMLAGIGLSDGRIELWHLGSMQRLANLSLRQVSQESSRAGVLQGLRISASGNIAMAWGLNLGTTVWNTLTGQALWSSAVNGPRGAMDGVLIDSPTMIRLALPNAPISLAETDPFGWAEAGRGGSDIMTRPLDGTNSVAATWSVPMHCIEPVAPRAPTNKSVRVHHRVLSHDGEALLTFSSGPASATITNASIFHWWNLHQHGRLGSSGPQRQGSVVIPGRVLWFPIAASANAALVATQIEERAMRIYNVHSGEHIEIPTGGVPPDAHIALSNDGALLAFTTAEKNRVDLWMTSTGKRLQRWDVQVPITALAFGNVGNAPYLAIGRKDGICEIWSMQA